MKDKVKCIFERTEKKYLLTEEQYHLLLEKSKEYIKADEYGITSICNIYYDTSDSELIRTSIEKPMYKEKFRVRSYGIPTSDDSKVFLEIKKKYDGIVYKRRAAMTFKESEDYLSNGIKPGENSQIINEIDYIIKHYDLKPKLFLAYDRIAYAGIENKDLRVTFDNNIRSREDNLSLKAGSEGETLLDNKTYLMEIKANGAMPLWLAELLSELKIYPLSFSKYGSIYKKNLAEQLNEENEKSIFEII